MIRLFFYTYSDENQFHPTDTSNASHGLWTGIRSKIARIAGQNSAGEEIKIIEGEVDDEWEKTIIVLLLPANFLSARKRFFDAMAQSKNNPLRPTTKPKKRRSQNTKKPFYYPVITVALPDIMGLFSESLEKEYQSSEKKYLLDLQPDKRFKFLDSGIWHRYVPLSPNRGCFEEYFAGVFNEVAGYWADGLYYTHAAIATLEFQVRMLRHSFITRTGERGHDENVTPFKFHSESWMQQKAAEEIQFFTFPGWNGGSLVEQLKWRVLIIDDQARGKHISSIDNRCRVEKEALILKPLSDLCKRYGLQFAKKISVKIPHDGNSHDDLVRAALDCLREENYDIIFLDYLLGDHRLAGRREYGYELILDLINDYHAGDPSDPETKSVRRDFQGRHWIFQISSFPFAFPDKLNQLGLSHLHEIWHLGTGGDPIVTPHLYAYYLYRFMKQKVGRYFLYPELLERIFKDVPVDISQNKNQNLWAAFLRAALESRRKQDKLLADQTFDKNASLFLESIQEFLENQDYLKPILVQIQEILDYLLGDITLSVSGLNTKCALMVAHGGNYSKALQTFTTIAKRLALQKYNEAIKIIEETDAGAPNLELKELALTEVPEEISRLTALKVIDLSGNKLSEFPYSLFNLTKLRKINLAENDLQWLPDPTVFSALGNLIEVNLTGNPGLSLGKIEGEDNRDFITKLSRTYTSLRPESQGKHIFIGYSRNDAKHLDILVKKLNAYKYHHNFTIFYDKKTNAGALWDEEVKKQIMLSQIIVFLCSDHMLTSDYIRTIEVPLAVERHKNATRDVTIIPVRLHQFGWAAIPELSKFAALPFRVYPTIEEYTDNGKLHEGWDHVALEIVSGIPPI